MIAAMIIAAAITVFAVLKDDGREVPPSTSDGATQPATMTGDLPAAPWRAATVPRTTVPPPYVTAWDQARNRTTCALLFPVDGGPEMAGAEATFGKTSEDKGWDIFLNGPAGSIEVLALFPVDGGPEMAGAQPTSGKTPEDKGWDIFLNGPAGSIEVLALFDKATQTGKPTATPSFTKSWSDGSVAKYAPDAGNAAPGTYDTASSPFEAVLTLPDQSCAYRIYDTLGKVHLESLFDRLRLMAL